MTLPNEQDHHGTACDCGRWPGKPGPKLLPVPEMPWRSRDELPGGWWELGDCNGHGDPDLWYPAAEDGRTVAEAGAQALAAQAICAGCPVRGECLFDALESRERYGIRGGYTVRGRAALQRAYGRGLPWPFTQLITDYRDQGDGAERAAHAA